MKATPDGNSPSLFRLGLITKQAFSISNFRGPLVQKMVDLGIKVFALAPDYDDETRAAVAALGAVPVDYTISPTGMNPLRDVASLFKLSKLLRSLRLDATFTYFIKPVIYGTIAARLAHVPRRYAMIEGAGYVFTDDEKPSFKRRLLRTFVSWLYKLSLCQTDRVFLLNPDDKELFVKEHMVSPEKTQLLDGIGVDLNHYLVAPRVLTPVCFIMIARLLREKGVYDFIEASRRVKAVHPEVRCMLLGGIDANPGAVSPDEVRSWLEEGVVELPGHVPDVRSWIAQASVFVLPSYYREGLPRSAQEAMAMGRPVITTNWVGCKETVIEGVNGFLLPVRSPEALAQAMLNFVEHPERILTMGEASRNLAEQRFDVHKIDAQILGSMGIWNAKRPLVAA